MTEYLYKQCFFRWHMVSSEEEVSLGWDCQDMMEILLFAFIMALIDPELLELASLHNQGPDLKPSGF